MIYVDQLKPCVRSKTWRNDESCWLLAAPAQQGTDECLEALHTFAESIFLKRTWLRQSREGVPHYVLSPQRRTYAITQGAHEADQEKLRQVIKSWQALAAAKRRAQKARGSRAAKPGSHAIQQPTTT